MRRRGIRMRITRRYGYRFGNRGTKRLPSFSLKIDRLPRTTTPRTGIELYREGKKATSRRTVSMVFSGLVAALRKERL